uniref:tRNA endonuclease ANKZF1 n=1 Tax=Myxine glutinosa TaxID=7769 RepID=UPI00358FE737
MTTRCSIFSLCEGKVRFYPNSTDGPLSGLVVNKAAYTEPERTSQSAHSEQPESTERPACSTCLCQLDGRQEQVEHYKTDWHRFNLKQRLMGGSPVSAERFEAITGDISSISGSGSESGESSDEGDDRARHTNPTATSHCLGSKVGDEKEDVACRERGNPKIILQNSEGKLLAVYRCALHSKKEHYSDEDFAEKLNCLCGDAMWVVLMAGGGHFAGAVFRGDKVIAQKTFHRYTVRAKRGTAQGLRDMQSHGNVLKSAGASLRRYNESALARDVQELLKAWTEYIRLAVAIFVRAPCSGKGLLFAEKPPLLLRRDERVRSIPFNTRRPTLKEVLRTHKELASILLYEKGSTIAMKDCLTKEKNKVKKLTEKLHKENPPEALHKDVAQNSDSDSSESQPMELCAGEEVHLTLHLRELEVFHKRRRKKKKKKKVSTKDGVENPSADLKTRLQSDLYTACQSGDVQKLQELLQHPLPLEESAVSERTSVTGPFEPRSCNGSEDMESIGQGGDDVHFVTSEKAGLEKADRSSEAVGVGPEYLLNTALLNKPMGKNDFTPLHVAAFAGHHTAVTLLLEAGSDPAIRNRKGNTAYNVSTQKTTRAAFISYRETHPQKYDYDMAQIPVPLTEEEKQQRADKLRAQKSIRRERERERQREQQRAIAEEEERIKFAALSDREKRAVAAERRIVQLSTKCTNNIARCWFCGKSFEGKTPFEYLDFYFCSVVCLQLHRKERQTRQ